jgi:hypothetical protein
VGPNQTNWGPGSEEKPARTKLSQQQGIFQKKLKERLNCSDKRGNRNCQILKGVTYALPIQKQLKARD